ncbi:MAG: hypothetical protein Q9160_008171 [Pyrenula sp. 1 TL-2023]
MASVSSLTAQPLTPGNGFNWIFLIELLVCGILAIFFLFYFNRLFATLLSYGLRAYTWRKYKAYVDIQALQVSLLGGRIFFKGVRYHGKNETILVQSGYLTWKYWLRSVRQVDCKRFKQRKEERLNSIGNSHNEKNAGPNSLSDRSSGETGAIEEVKDLPCRISIFAQGLEWIVYNRSPAYDAILSSTGLQTDATSLGKPNQHGRQSNTVGLKAEHGEGAQSGARLRKTKKPAAGLSITTQDGISTAKSASKISNDTCSSKNSAMDAGEQLADLAETASLAESQITTPPEDNELKLPFAISLLPISIDCQKGAIVLGNENTRVILASIFDRVKGRIDASSAGPLDLYRQLFDFNITHPIVQMRPNPDFKQSQEEKAEQLNSGGQTEARYPKSKFFHWPTRRWKQKLTYGLRGLIPRFRNSVESFRPVSPDNSQRRHYFEDSRIPSPRTPWLGLDRYLDEEARDEHAGWNSVEYARYSTLVDCPSINFTFYWDVPGPVMLPSPAQNAVEGSDKRHLDDINGSKAPAYGLKILIDGGIINYGPWADRMRIEIQNILFPNPYTSVKPATSLEKGSVRQSTVFAISIELVSETILRIPSREESKDWQWKGRANAIKSASRIRQENNKKPSRHKRGDQTTHGPDIRPFGWLSLYLSSDSTVAFDMDMIGRKNGYRNLLRFDVRQTKMTSSVNHDILWRSGALTGQCDLSNPLQWNALHMWTFNITIDAMEMFILRDHMFMLTDLIGDWGSSLPADFWTFVPFHYQLSLAFNDLKLYLNANDSNIINNPSDLNDNAFLVLAGHRLDSSIEIPLEKYRPNRNAVTFNAVLKDTRLQLVTPLWSTHRSFLSDHPVATLKHFTMDGAFNYNLSTSALLTDSLFFDLSGQSPRIFLHGFLIRYFINIKENYFGDNIHFRTLEEFQGSMLSRQESAQDSEPVSTKKSSDLDVILTVRAHNASILLPSNLYTRKDNIKLDLLLVESDMRFNNYYSDISADFNTVEASLESVPTEDVGAYGTVSNVQLYVDGITIYGHRLFGTGPTEPTYVCNWDFEIGDILGECSSAFLRTLILSVRCFAFCLDDDENALPVSAANILRDMTFLRAKVSSLKFWFLTENFALLLSSSSIFLNFDDRAGNFSTHLTCEVPELSFAAVDRRLAARHRDSDRARVPTHAYFTTGVNVKMVSRKPGYLEEGILQLKYVNAHDERSQRVPWLSKGLDEQRSLPKHDAKKHTPPPMPLPSMPAPLRSGIYQSTTPNHRRRSANPVQDPAEAHSSTSKEFEGHSTDRFLPAPSAPRTRARSQPRVPGMTFSTPWLPPHFTMANVEPDLSDLPSLEEHSKLDSLEGQSITDRVDLPADSQSSHVGLFIQLKDGLKGVCRPSFAQALTQILDEVSSRHPADILDDLQIKTMSDILNSAKSKSKTGLMLDSHLRLPCLHLRLINTYHASRDGESGRERDSYDFELENLQVRFRNRKQRRDMTKSKNDTSEIVAHLVSRQARLTISERAGEGQIDKAAVQGIIRDVSFWLSNGAHLDAKTQVKTVDFVTWSRKMEYLAAIIHRTTEIAKSAATDFNYIASQGTYRLRNLVHFLAQSSKDLPDPLFLTRPSYVLRAADDHLRADDSWKIMSRLRSIYRSLTDSQRENLISRCNSAVHSYSVDAQNNVLSIFDQWRAWDLAHVENSQIMKSIWGLHSTNHLSTRHRGTSVRAAVIISEIRFLLDPGPKQTELVLADLTSSLHSDYPGKDVKEGFDSSVSYTEVINIQAYCSECALRINWEMIELIDDTIELFQQRSGSPAILSPPTNIQSLPQPKHRIIHVVFGTDLVAATLDSINLKVAVGSKGLRGSIVQTIVERCPGIQPGVNIILSSSSISAKIATHTTSLITWRAFQPNVYMSLTTLDQPETGNALRAVVTCQQLYFDVEEEIRGVLDILGRVISDEASAVGSILARQSSTSPNLSDSRASSASRSSKWRLHASLLLDNCDVSITLLPFLVYTFNGKVARTAVTPQPRGAVRLDFDVKQQAHGIRSKEALAPTSSLELPPINGSSVIRFKQDPVSISFKLVIEKIKLEGGNVRAWVDTLTKPEISRLFLDAQKEIQKIKSRIEESFPSSPTSAFSEAERGSGIAYSAKIGCDGLKVQTSAPALSDRGYKANLDFNLGVLTARIHNTDLGKGTLFEKPQISFTISQISLGLNRQREFDYTNYGKFSLGISMTSVTENDYRGVPVQSHRFVTEGVLIELYAETAALVIDVADHLQKRIKSLDLAPEIRHLSGIRRMTRADFREPSALKTSDSESEESASNLLFGSALSVSIRNIQLIWIVDDMSAISPGRELEDLVFSVSDVDLTTQQANAAKLTIQDLQMQMVPKGNERSNRSLNSALLPEMVFHVGYISTAADRRLAFQAAGKALNLRLTSDFIVPANVLQSSLTAASKEIRQAKAFQSSNPSMDEPMKPLFGGKRLVSLLVDVDFAGAVVTMQARPEDKTPKSVFSILKGPKRSKAGRYGQIFQGSSDNKTTLRAPGIAFKVEYKDLGNEDPSLNAEIKVAASSNILYPSVVPLILEVSSSVKEIMGETDAKSIATETLQSQMSIQEASSNVAPGILGRCKVNVGIWIRSQEFGLSCQPIARVAATARFDEIIVTINTVQAADQERFFALLLSFSSLQAHVQHVYSRESTASFDVKSVVMSLMNSKHVSSTTGLSAILKISPVKTSVNVKQLQDFLLFREIWYPAEVRNATSGPAPPPNTEDQPYVVQRYQQVAAAGAFPWNAVVAIAQLDVKVDLGQSLGMSEFTIHNLWASSRKTSDWEQNLCIGFENVGLQCTGRMSGFVELQNFKIRTSISWPLSDSAFQQTPLIQASLGFGGLRVKGSFDYQPFVIADITSFNFLMYNVREPNADQNDRLVAILDGDKVQIFCTTASASQALALFQAVERLKQEKQAAYEASIRELDRHLRRRSIYPSGGSTSMLSAVSAPETSSPKAPISLHTDVVVTLQALKVGAFPSTFFDNTIFKIEAHDAQARFAVSVANNDRTHSGLGLTLGQLRVALSSVQRPATTAPLGEVAVDDIVSRATGSRGGTILKVPKVVATMQTWQAATAPLSTNIDYIFKSSFEGKVDVGWNYSRISFIRGMWSTHSRALSHRLGKPLTQSAVQITGAPPASTSDTSEKAKKRDQLEGEKITAVVNVPQSRFEYNALEPPVIETPQLRDMGEATPPLEWIGLQRERLPNLTHQIIIVGLLEVCREVEEAYGRILGRS